MELGQNAVSVFGGSFEKTVPLRRPCFLRGERWELYRACYVEPLRDHEIRNP